MRDADELGHKQITSAAASRLIVYIINLLLAGSPRRGYASFLPLPPDGTQIVLGRAGPYQPAAHRPLNRRKVTRTSRLTVQSLNFRYFRLFLLNTYPTIRGVGIGF